MHIPNQQTGFYLAVASPQTVPETASAGNSQSQAGRINQQLEHTAS